MDEEATEKEKRLVKTMRFEIVKPVGCDWDEFGKTLNTLASQSRRVANYLTTQLWAADQEREDFKRRNGAYPKTEKSKPYLMLTETFPEMGTQVLSAIQRLVERKYKEDRTAIYRGEKSLPSFKNMPICVHNQAWNLEKSDDNNYIFGARLLSRKAENMWYRFIVRVKSGSQKSVLEKLLSEESKKGMMQIVTDNKGKRYALVSFGFPPKQQTQPETKTLYITMDENGIYLTTERQRKDPYNIPIYDIQETLKRFRARSQQIVTQRKYRGNGRIGHGRAAIFEPQQSLQDKIAAFKSTKNHALSRHIVDTANRWRCTDILIINKDFIPDWPVCDLCLKIEYKAKELSISYND